MPFPDLPPDRIPGSPGHLHDHKLIDQALDYIQAAAYKNDPDFPPLPDVPVLGQSGHVTAHDRIRAVLDYVKQHPSVNGPATISNSPTGSYSANGHNYAYYTFTASGTLTVTSAGVASVLMVGAGGKGFGERAGAGGQIVTLDSLFLTEGNHDLIVAQSPKTGTEPGKTMAFGVIARGGGSANDYGPGSDGANQGAAYQSGSHYWPGPGAGYIGSSSGAGGGAGGSASGNTPGPGVVLSFTGTPVEYAKGGTGGANPTPPGYGSGGSGASQGRSGAIIVRVQTN